MEFISTFTGMSDHMEKVPIFTVSKSDCLATPLKSKYIVYSDLGDLVSEPCEMKNEETDVVLFDDFNNSVVKSYSSGQSQEEYTSNYSDELQDISDILSISDTLSDFQFLLPFEQSDQHIVDTYLVPDADLNVQVVEKYN